MKSRIRPAGLFAFFTTSALILGAASLNANPPQAKEHRAALDIVSRHFKPQVAAPTREVRGTPLGNGFRAEFIPVQDDSASVEVVITRDDQARGVATANLQLECTFTSFNGNGRSRVPRPAQSEQVRQDIAATLAPGQSLRKRVTFKPRRVDGLTPGQLIVRSNGAVVSQDIYIAALSGPGRPIQPANLVY